MQGTNGPCRLLSIHPSVYGPKGAMGHFLGAENAFFLIRGDDAALAHSCRTGLILSIRGPEASLGSLRVGVYMVSRLHRIRRRFEHYRPILSALQAIWT